MRDGMLRFRCSGDVPKKRSLTATRERPDVSHRGGKLRQPEASASRVPDGMLRFRCCGDVPKRVLAS